MKKNPIGFNTKIFEEPEKEASVAYKTAPVVPRKSVVQVYFPHRGMGWAYYNDSFDLKVGDFVYVEGKLEGYRGQVTEVNYSFKIKLSDYKRVITVVDTNVVGDFYLAGSHLVTFDENAIPFKKALTWFKAPEEDAEFISSDDDTNAFSIDDLSGMNIQKYDADRGYDYYMDSRVVFIEIDGLCGRAIIEGSKFYEVEFDYIDGEIGNLKCSCYCSGACRHEFAAILQLKETLKFITDNYDDYYEGYFAAISKCVFMNTVMSKKVSGKISLGV